MRSIKISALIYISLTTLALLMTFIFGVHVGSHQLLLMDSSAQAVLLTNELKAIRAGNAEKLIEKKEIELDGKVVWALQFEEHGHPWLFYPLSENYDHERYLHSVALYRMSYPSPTPTLVFGGDEEHKNEMKNYQAEVAKKTKLLIDRYGK
jgi:hypothetical protein